MESGNCVSFLKHIDEIKNKIKLQHSEKIRHEMGNALKNSMDTFIF